MILSIVDRRHDLIHCVYLYVNKLSLEYEDVDEDIRETIRIEAFADHTGRTNE